jgi:hypothetical protein
VPEHTNRQYECVCMSLAGGRRGASLLWCANDTSLHASGGSLKNKNGVCVAFIFCLLSLCLHFYKSNLLII